MLTFFRKIRKGLLASQQTRKYVLYAVGEIVLVVVGILIALQINNWNQWRKERDKEKDVINQLHIEFLKNSNELERTIGGNMRNLYEMEKVIALFPINTEDVNLDTLQFYFPRVAQGLYTFNPSSAVVGAISNSNSLDLITNDSLRNKLMLWTSVLDDFLEDQSHVRAYIADHVSIYFQKNGMLTQNGIGDDRVDMDLFGSAEFESLIIRRRELIHNIYGNRYGFPELETLKSTINEIIELTEGYD